MKKKKFQAKKLVKEEKKSKILLEKWLENYYRNGTKIPKNMPNQKKSKKNLVRNNF